ncbi:reverse transcriptase (RNA-dependent DNA polymerase) [Hirsutella rhossiliensis]
MRILRPREDQETNFQTNAYTAGPAVDQESFVRVMFFTDAFSGMVFPYFLRTYLSKHNWSALRDFVNWMKSHFGYESQEEALDEETEEETDVEAVEDNADFKEEEAARSDDPEEEGDYRKAVELEYAYLPTPPPTQEQDLEAAFLDYPAAFLSLLREAKEGIGPDTKEDQFLPYFNRFSDFYLTPIEDGSHGAFTAGRLFKPLSARKKQLERHPFRDQFFQAQKDHLASHEEMGSFEEEKGDLPTRATTLAGMSFRTLMAIAAEFDLELD